MVTFDRANDLFLYDEYSGIVIRKINHGRCKAGDFVGCKNKRGYLRVWIDGEIYYVHRIAWLLKTGKFPDFELDHINGVTNDNRFVNLRDVSHSKNMFNAKKNSKNTSGSVGVYFHKKARKWVAQINVFNGHQKHLGVFENIRDAVTAYETAKLFYHS